MRGGAPRINFELNTCIYQYHSPTRDMCAHTHETARTGTVAHKVPRNARCAAHASRASPMRRDCILQTPRRLKNLSLAAWDPTNLPKNLSLNADLLRS